MGLLKHLLFWPVTGPSFLTRFSLEKVGDTVREELTNDQAVKEELLSLQMRLELGEIDDDEYVEEEAAVMRQLRDVRYWREQFGMGTSGGPVRVSAPTDEGPNVAEDVVATPEGSPDAEAGIEPESPKRGGIASADGASVEISFDWD
ncbi:MAG TPA: gas vesicle protein GvpG [Longimicrobiaceae bacterium]|nr:gas vesicle protein GvpG [Longimicrobiaceae bacterium]